MMTTERCNMLLRRAVLAVGRLPENKKEAVVTAWYAWARGKGVLTP